ncbi:MAG TPA: hypothetical protein VF138_09535 [Caulobacteraceae bacterium]
MKLRTLALAAAMTLAAAPAFAASGKISVALQSPVAAKTKVVAAGAVFSCADTSCVAFDAPSRAISAAACKAIVKEVGPVLAFTGERNSLEAADLQRCNGVAATVTAAN